MRDNPAPYWAAEHARALTPSPTGDEDAKPSPPKGPRTGAANPNPNPKPNPKPKPKPKPNPNPTLTRSLTLTRSAHRRRAVGEGAGRQDSGDPDQAVAPGREHVVQAAVAHV